MLCLMLNSNGLFLFELVLETGNYDLSLGILKINLDTGEALRAAKRRGVNNVSNKVVATGGLVYA